jgi:hypothetical protein
MDVADQQRNIASPHHPVSKRYFDRFSPKIHGMEQGIGIVTQPREPHCNSAK